MKWFTSSFEIEGTKQILESPWSADVGAMEGYLPALLDTLTTVEEMEIAGRINVNQARIEVLLGLPDMTVEIAEAIVSTPVSIR